MKKFLKSQKGINLISLSIAVMIILVLTGMIIYNVKDNLKLEKLRNMQADIENLRDKVSSYYAQYGEIPANKSVEYTNIQNIKNAGLISEAVDIGKFYVIDLASMENITLNYGEDYEKIRSGEATTSEEINALTDLYIINDASHNIFFVEGIEIDGERFYTDYTKEDVDTESVDLKYVDGVKIPDGFYYVGGTKDTGLVISDVEGDDLDNSKQGNQFVWIPVESQSDYIRNTSYEKLQLSQSAVDDTGYLPDGINEKTAVINAGGFYLSRFEAGKEETATLVSKKGATVWNNITQENAKVEAKKFINNDNVKSALCSGIQWDMVMNLINGKENEKGEIIDVTKANPSNHIGELNNSGMNETDKFCNIYDLEGNAYEYIAEKNLYDSRYPCVYRGGANSNRYSNPASFRDHGSGPTNSIATFRFVLYVIQDDKWSPTYDKTATYTDKNGDTATIPAGFQVSENQGEDEIKEGLVVKGPDGSEFVWVPVDKTTFDTKFKRTEGYSNNGSLQSYINTSGEAGADGNNSYLQANGLDESEETKAEAIKMYSSVKTYGGFYIGRYEAGRETINGVEKVVSKKNVKAYNNIPWSSSTTTNIDTGGAVEKARGMAVANNYTSVTSTLCYGVQWDATLNFIDSDYITNETSEGLPNCRVDSYIVNSIEQGWYNGVSGGNDCITGVDMDSQASNKVKNIYDMAGNVYEWTMESIDKDRRARRGGDYSYTSASVSMRGPYNQKYTNYNTGFRVTLYLNE